jgi:hypothetical protein
VTPFIKICSSEDLSRDVSVAFLIHNCYDVLYSKLSPYVNDMTEV